MGLHASVWAISRSGNHKKWGVAGGLGTLRITFLSYVAQDTARSWFGALSGQTAQSLGFWGAFWGCFSDISCVELEGTKGLFDTRR